MLPKLVVVGAYAFTNPNLIDGFENRFGGGFSVGATLSIPLWHWGGNYTLDSVTIEPVLSYMLSDISKPFYAFYTSLSMHGPYANPSNNALLRGKYYTKLAEAIDKEDFYK